MMQALLLFSSTKISLFFFDERISKKVGIFLTEIGMSDEQHVSESRRMDLNLYLGLPLSPRPQRLNLGSDLALGCPPIATMELPSDSLPAQTEHATDFPTVLPAADDAAGDDYVRYDPAMPAYDPSDPRDFAASFSPLQEAQGPDAPYPPPSPQALPNVQELEEATTMDVAADLQYDPVSYSSPLHVAESISYSSPFNPAPETPHGNAGCATPRFYPSDANLSGEFARPSDVSSLRFGSTSISRFRRLGEARFRLPRQGLRSSMFCPGARRSLDLPVIHHREQAVQDNLESQVSSDYDGKHKASAENNASDASEEERDEKRRNGAYFECNICFDMSIEPVVTSCGHLFCWPCLYQWLHLYSDHKECPVCKGEVTEANITPIYGRGSSSKTIADNPNGDGEESSPVVPPRPRGNRLESSRQHLQPNGRRVGERIESWRHLFDQNMHFRGRIIEHSDPEFREVLARFSRRMTRLRVRRLQRDENPENGSVSAEHGLPTLNMMPNPNDVTSASRDEFDHRLSLYGINAERLAALTSDLRRVIRGFNETGTSTSSVDPLYPDQRINGSHAAALAPEQVLATDQASASSTMAVIQGDVVAPDAPVEPNCAESSRPHRRSERSSASSSYDVDGGTLQSFKKRRLN